MAKIIVNAKISKEDKNYPGGIALSVKGRRDIGVVDIRKTTYKDQHIFYAGINWNENKQLLSITDEIKKSNANIGVFVSTYPIQLVKGKMLVNTHIEVGTEISSVCFKRDIGGYNKEDEIVEVLEHDLVVINPKKVSLYLAVGTAPDKLIIKNKEGFNFVCDFKKNNWFTLRPGASELEMYDYNNDIEKLDLLKEKLPFPGLDRKLYDESVNLLENGRFDVKSHAIKYV